MKFKVCKIDIWKPLGVICLGTSCLNHMVVIMVN